jgi:hypothetical protein
MGDLAADLLEYETGNWPVAESEKMKADKLDVIAVEWKDDRWADWSVLDQTVALSALKKDELSVFCSAEGRVGRMDF